MESNQSESLLRAKQALQTISVTKQEVFGRSALVFNQLKTIAQAVSTELEEYIQSKDSRIHVELKDVNQNEFWLQFGGDLLIFSLHTNIFSFDRSHSLYNSQYILDNPSRAYFSMIEVFNFLNDSVKYNRMRDVGELVARIFVNGDNHFFVEGMGAIGSLYTDLSSQQFVDESISQVLENIIVGSIQYDLWAPPFQDVRFIPLVQVIDQNGNSPRSTAKRLGFSVQDSTDQSIT